jgi:hypothetical protein
MWKKDAEGNEWNGGEGEGKGDDPKNKRKGKNRGIVWMVELMGILMGKFGG